MAIPRGAMPPSGRVVGLGLDAGGTATRWVLLSGDDILARGEAGPISGHMLLPGSEAKVSAELSSIAGQAGAFPRPDGIFAGVTGTSSGSSSSRTIEGLLATGFGIPPGAVSVSSDLWITYHACFGPGEGIVAYSGTGSAAIHVTAAGDEIRAGGLGHLIDDAGSGFWIGQTALRALLRAEEETPGLGWSGHIGNRIADMVGDRTWPSVRSYVYGGDRSRMALLARAVGDAATIDGDSAARGILVDAGKEIGRLVLALRGRLGHLPVALAGGAGNLPFVFCGLSQAVGREGVRSVVPDAALAAARLSFVLAAGDRP